MPRNPRPSAWFAPPNSRISILLAAPRPLVAAAPVDLAERRLQIADKFRIGPLAGRGPRDQHIIGSRPPAARQHFGRNRPQSPLRPIADHRIADPSARREPHPHRLDGGACGRLRRRLQYETRSDRPPARRSNTQKIGAGLEPCKPTRHRSPNFIEPPSPRLSDAGRTRPGAAAAARQADRRLRPFARRAASTRRPPGVAIRERKPWRRLRTSLLG